MSFSRTGSGLKAGPLFYQKAVVYVEGDSDIPFYHQVLQGYNYHIKLQHGKEEGKKLVAVLEQDDSPYVVILDGDYEILERTRSKHRRVILLHRYSFENYLFEEEPIEQFCRDRTPSEARLKELVSRFQKVIEDTELKFKELIVLDVAHQRSHTGYDVLPNKPDRFLKPGRSVNFRDDQIQQRCTEAAQCIDRQRIEEARNLVDKFLSKCRFIDLLPGHFAFGIMRRLIIHTIDRSISDEDVRVPLSRAVWGLVETDDHDSLKRRLRRAVREAQNMPRPGKGAQG